MTTNNTLPAVAHLIDSALGQYIPQRFVVTFDLSQWGLVRPDLMLSIKACMTGPDHPDYWEAWDALCNAARYAPEYATDPEDYWYLHQDGDLWTLNDYRMTNEEYENFHGDMKPAPAGWYEWAVCNDCLNYIAYDELPPYNDEVQDNAFITAHEQTFKDYTPPVADGAEYGFRHDNCEVCGALPGDRYRVMAQAKPATP